jgi:hypothetical protein
MVRAMRNRCKCGRFIGKKDIQCDACFQKKVNSWFEDNHIEGRSHEELVTSRPPRAGGDP